MKTERNKWEVILDILKATKDGNVKKTRIMQSAYLDWRNFNRHWVFLIENGFIVECDQDYYTLTEKGQNLSNKLEEVSETF